jgi:hypothetical protein
LFMSGPGVHAVPMALSFDFDAAARSTSAPKAVGTALELTGGARPRGGLGGLTAGQDKREQWRAAKAHEGLLRVVTPHARKCHRGSNETRRATFCDKQRKNRLSGGEL